MKLTKAERMGLEEVRDYGWCARTEPVIDKLMARKLIERDWRTIHFINYKLTPDGRSALGLVS